jgi:hypothetical protein
VTPTKSRDFHRQLPNMCQQLDIIEIFDVVNSNIYRQIFGHSPNRPELLEFDLKLDILELELLDLFEFLELYLLGLLESLELRRREHSKNIQKKVQYDTR